MHFCGHCPTPATSHRRLGICKLLALQKVTAGRALGMGALKRARRARSKREAPNRILLPSTLTRPAFSQIKLELGRKRSGREGHRRNQEAPGQKSGSWPLNCQRSWGMSATTRHLRRLWQCWDRSQASVRPLRPLARVQPNAWCARPWSGSCRAGHGRCPAAVVSTKRSAAWHGDGTTSCNSITRAVSPLKTCRPSTVCPMKSKRQQCA